MFWLINCIIAYVAVIAAMCYSSATQMKRPPSQKDRDRFIKKNTKRYGK